MCSGKIHINIELTLIDLFIFTFFVNNWLKGYGHNPPGQPPPPIHFCIRGQNPPHEFYN